MNRSDETVIHVAEGDCTRDFTLLADLAQQNGGGVTLQLSPGFLARSAEHLGALVLPFTERSVFVRLRHAVPQSPVPLRTPA